MINYNWLALTHHLSDAIHGLDAWHGPRMTRGFLFRCIFRSDKLSKRLAKRCTTGSPASRNGRPKISSILFITRWLCSRPCSIYICLHWSFSVRYVSISNISQRLLSQICGSQRMLSKSEGFSMFFNMKGSQQWLTSAETAKAQPESKSMESIWCQIFKTSTSIWEDSLLWPTFISLLAESKRLPIQ